jgi:site-specific recombinase XerD
MTDPTSLGHWIRRFLMEYAASERNLSANTRASYRDMLVLLLPYAARHKRAAVDELSVTDLSAEVVRLLSRLPRVRTAMLYGHTEPAARLDPCSGPVHRRA